MNSLLLSKISLILIRIQNPFNWNNHCEEQLCSAAGSWWLPAGAGAGGQKKSKNDDLNSEINQERRLIFTEPLA